MPDTANPEHELRSLLVRTMVLLCFRHSVIEDTGEFILPFSIQRAKSTVVRFGRGNNVLDIHSAPKDPWKQPFGPAQAFTAPLTATACSSI